MNFRQHVSDPCRSVAKKIFVTFQSALHQNLANLGLEARHVAAPRLLRAIAVARKDRLEHRPVLAYRLAQPHALVEPEEPQAQAQVEVPLGSALEERVARAAVHGAVDLLVELHELALVDQLDRREPGEQLPDRGSVDGGAALGGKARRVALQHDANLGYAR